ncbi:glycosyltransferase family 4 protein [Polaribacter sargassicola]|uniref:glycosyltransferase family 4 protein n=1 Tax=Polaribacter sargassicola TaxID=2836891 RepID=UPI001F2D2742|nr:glycosyltransferase family 4 protein [Polaribacter sp. DS7-9]MCG1036609.1 glycosyltransferase family 4 protein [Polaribacter sp. DS7-9]
MNKKVAVVCNYILKPDRIGGMDRFFRLFDEQLKENEYHVDWFFTAYTTFDFYKNLNIYKANHTSVEKKFLEVSCNHNYDIVITHFTELCTKFYKDVKKQNPNSYVVAVDHNPRPLQGYSLKKSLVKKVKSILYSTYINRFIAVSAYSKKHLINDFGLIIKNKITVVYNGIDTKNFISKQNYSFTAKFIVACHLRKEKGLQHLLKALNNLKKTYSGSIIVDVYGEGPYENELRKKTEEFKLSKIVNYKGSVDNLSEIYHQYDYLIHPSLGETFCYSVVEALLCKLPVITTKNAGNVLGLIKEEYNGFLFMEQDINKLTEILKNILTHQIKIEESNFNCIKIPDFTLDNMVKNHLRILP